MSIHKAHKETPGLGVLPGRASYSRFAASMRLTWHRQPLTLSVYTTLGLSKPLSQIQAIPTWIPPVLRKVSADRARPHRKLYSFGNARQRYPLRPRPCDVNRDVIRGACSLYQDGGGGASAHGGSTEYLHQPERLTEPEEGTGEKGRSLTSRNAHHGKSIS
jgi:hypothetical protein